VDRRQFYTYDKTTEEINATPFRFYVQKKIKFFLELYISFLRNIIQEKKFGNFLRQRATKILPT